MAALDAVSQTYLRAVQKFEIEFCKLFLHAYVIIEQGSDFCRVKKRLTARLCYSSNSNCWKI